MKIFRIISYAALFAAIGLISCNPNSLYRAVTGITLNRDSLVLCVGDEFVLQATITPDNATEQPIITWSSSNDNVARVTNGVVTSISGGTAHIIAQAGDKTATCKVVVGLNGTTWKFIINDDYQYVLSFGVTTFTMKFMTNGINQSEFSGTYTYHHPNVYLYGFDDFGEQYLLTGIVNGHQMVFSDLEGFIFIKQ